MSEDGWLQHVVLIGERMRVKVRLLQIMPERAAAT